MTRVILSSILFVACSSSPERDDTLSGFAQRVGLQANFSESYKNVDNVESTSGALRINRYVFRAGTRTMRILKLSGIERLQGESYIKEKIAQFESLYEYHRDPYSQTITKGTKCSSDLEMKHKNENRGDSDLHVLSLYSNDRLTYGACTKDQATHKATVVLMRCSANNNVFFVENFVPVKEYSDADRLGIDSLQCL